jgi:hypothetical protein
MELRMIGVLLNADKTKAQPVYDIPHSGDNGVQLADGAAFADERELTAQLKDGWTYQRLLAPAPLPRVTVEIDVRELATILHALRIFQLGFGDELAGCDHFEDHTMLTDGEVDALCGRLNGEAQ